VSLHQAGGLNEGMRWGRAKFFWLKGGRGGLGIFQGGVLGGGVSGTAHLYEGVLGGGGVVACFCYPRGPPVRVQTFISDLGLGPRVDEMAGQRPLLSGLSAECGFRIVFLTTDFYGN